MGDVKDSSYWHRLADSLQPTGALLIDGRAEEAADSRTFTSYDPAAGRGIADVARGDAADIDRAVVALEAGLPAGVLNVVPAHSLDKYTALKTTWFAGRPR